jgi:hypothetical protein
MSTVNANQVKRIKVMVSERAKECGIIPSVAQEKFKKLVADFYEVETISTKDILVEDYEHLCSLINAEIKPIETKKSVFELISLVQGDLAREGISKDRTNQKQNYKFRGIDDVYNALSSSMARHGLVCVPEVLEIIKDSEKKTSSGGTMQYFIVKIKYTFYAPNGDFVVAIMYGEAANSGDKGLSVASSVAYKYMAFQTFAIPTEGDHDPENHSPEFVPIPKVQLISPEQAAFLRNEIIGFAKKEFPNTDPKTIGKMVASYLGVSAISDLMASEFEVIKRDLLIILNESTVALKKDLLSVEQLNELENMFADFSASSNSPLSEMKSMVLEKLNLKSFSDIKSNDFEQVKDLIGSLFEEK